jgi:hypothetical protein
MLGYFITMKTDFNTKTMFSYVFGMYVLTF